MNIILLYMENNSIDLNDIINNDINDINNDINNDIKSEEGSIKSRESNDTIDIFLGYSNPIFYCVLIYLLISFIILITITFLYNDKLDYLFGVNQLLKYLLVLFIQFIMALLVIYKDAKVNYTRKVVHISYFIWPQLLDIILIDYHKNLYTEIWNVWIILLLLFLANEKFRNKIKFLEIMYKAIDRPEDKPYTLFWFSTQIISTLFIIIPFSIYFSSLDKVSLIFIPILINGLGDGLAEPIGIRFGKHKYKTKSCCSSREYTRSYEGSSCVFIVSLIIILCFYKYFTLKRYIANVILIPIFSTLTEALSPHTWDSPLITLVICVILTLSLEI